MSRTLARLQEIVDPKSLANCKFGELELAFFKDYFATPGEKDPNAKNYLESVIAFFISADFKSIKAKYFSFLGEKEKSKLFYNLIQLIKKTDLETQKNVPALSKSIHCEIATYCLSQSSDHPVVINIISKLDTKQITLNDLENTYGNLANYIINKHLEFQPSEFFWPIEAASVSSNALCRLTLSGTLSLDDLSKMKKSDIKELQTTTVNDYLLRSMDDKQLPPPLEYTILNNFILATRWKNPGDVKRLLLVVSFLNKAELSTSKMERTILNHFTKKTDWTNPADIRNLLFIIYILNNTQFQKIKNLIFIPLTQESDKLKVIPAGMITEGGERKAQLLVQLKMDIFNEIIRKLASFELTKDPLNRIIDKDINRFYNHFNDCLSEKIKNYSENTPLCEHRNFGFRMLKTTLDSLTWLIQPAISINNRHRLFSPHSAKSIYTIEDTLTMTRQLAARHS